ncbi:MAG: motility protein A [Proteobacteria bacterium]|nr:motility protein A [Pseudomonadota bacterium]MBU4471507.1 motility protein A [Pseudomonadota bacterium]
MDIATLIGLIVSIGLVIVSILMGGPIFWFIDPPSLMIVGGGTLGSTLIAYPLAEVLSVIGVAKNAFLHKTRSAGELIPLMVDLAKKARQEGILSFESQLETIPDKFLAKGLQMAIDGMESDAIETVMRTEIDHVGERHSFGAEIFATMAAFAPAMGMLGTIIGLVQMLMQMEDPSSIGAPMAVALLTTFYGTVFANIFFIPISSKLKTRSKQEVLIKEIILEGVISIQSGDNHRIVEQKLKAFLSSKQQFKQLSGQETLAEA